MVARFEGKVAVVTGGASGIGKAAAEIFAREGARVALADINDNAGRGVADALGADTCFYQHCDVSSEDQIKDLIGQTVDNFGRLDILFNNAGVPSGGKETPDLSSDDWHRVVAINLNSVFYASKAAIPEMKKGAGGVIINTASTSGIRADAGFNAYNATKAAVINYTRTLAIDHGKDNIRANAVCPGPTLTPMAEGVLATPEMEKIWFPVIPLRRYGKPEDIANTVAFLASDEAAFITGQFLTVDGGVTCQTGHPNLMAFT